MLLSFLLVLVWLLYFHAKPPLLSPKNETFWVQICMTFCAKNQDILQARILEWLAMPSSRGSSQPRFPTQVSHIADGFFTIWGAREAQEYIGMGCLSLLQGTFLTQESTRGLWHCRWILNQGFFLPTKEAHKIVPGKLKWLVTLTVCGAIICKSHTEMEKNTLLISMHLKNLILISTFLDLYPEFR